MCVMEVVLFCAQQGISFRGHNEGTDATNFKCLMKLLSRHSEPNYMMVVEMQHGNPQHFKMK